MANTAKDTIKTRKVAILAADGVDDAAVCENEAGVDGRWRAGENRGSTARSLKGAKGAEVPSRFQFAHRQLGPVRCRLVPEEKRR